jgi:hypothetical protein
MFRNRKRKPKDEDDPLVPHGLIWYATEPLPSEKRGTGSQPNKTAGVIEITQSHGAKQQPEESPEGKVTPPTSPLHLQPSEVMANETRTASQNLPPQFNLMTIPQKPAAERSRSGQALRVAEVIEIAPCPPRESTSRRIVAVGLASLRKLSTNIRNGVRCLSTAVPHSWTWISNAIDFEKEFLRAKGFAHKFQRNVAAVATDCYRKAQSSINATENGLHQQQRVSGNLGAAFSAGTKRVYAYVSTRRFATKRVRIVLTGLPRRLRILFARRLSEWKMVQSGPGDIRLRSSMTLAAISATITMIIISLVPRYAAKSLPSRMFSSPVTVNASTVAPAAPVSMPLKSTPKKTPAAKPARQIQVQKSIIASRPTPRRKIYQAAEDDYIAPDTYTYYGSKSSVSR